jgi:hypothetical protein
MNPSLTAMGEPPARGAWGQSTALPSVDPLGTLDGD